MLNALLYSISHKKTAHKVSEKQQDCLLPNSPNKLSISLFISEDGGFQPFWVPHFWITRQPNLSLDSSNMWYFTIETILCTLWSLKKGVAFETWEICWARGWTENCAQLAKKKWSPSSVRKGQACLVHSPQDFPVAHSFQWNDGKSWRLGSL